MTAAPITEVHTQKREVFGVPEKWQKKEKFLAKDS